jgi:hypothetical protein
MYSSKLEPRNANFLMISQSSPITKSKGLRRKITHLSLKGKLITPEGFK